VATEGDAPPFSKYANTRISPHSSASKPKTEKSTQIMELFQAFCAQEKYSGSWKPGSPGRPLRAWSLYQESQTHSPYSAAPKNKQTRPKPKLPNQPQTKKRCTRASVRGKPTPLDDPVVLPPEDDRPQTPEQPQLDTQSITDKAAYRPSIAHSMAPITLQKARKALQRANQSLQQDALQRAAADVTVGEVDTLLSQKIEGQAPWDAYLKWLREEKGCNPTTSYIPKSSTPMRQHTTSEQYAKAVNELIKSRKDPARAGIGIALCLEWMESLIERNLLSLCGLEPVDLTDLSSSSATPSESNTLNGSAITESPHSDSSSDSSSSAMPHTLQQPGPHQRRMAIWEQFIDEVGYEGTWHPGSGGAGPHAWRKWLREHFHAAPSTDPLSPARKKQCMSEKSFGDPNPLHDATVPPHEDGREQSIQENEELNSPKGELSPTASKDSFDNLHLLHDSTVQNYGDLNKEDEETSSLGDKSGDIATNSFFNDDFQGLAFPE